MAECQWSSKRHKRMALKELTWKCGFLFILVSSSFLPFWLNSVSRCLSSIFCQKEKQISQKKRWLNWWENVKHVSKITVRVSFLADLVALNIIRLRLHCSGNVGGKQRRRKYQATIPDGNVGIPSKLSPFPLTMSKIRYFFSLFVETKRGIFPSLIGEGEAYVIHKFPLLISSGIVEICTCYSTLSRDILWINIPLVTGTFLVYTLAFFSTIPCHRKCSGQHNQSRESMRDTPAHDGKVGCCTVK